MRIIFAGTPPFARVALERLHAAGFEIPLVLTQPDRPAGRGLKLHASPVKQFALDHGIALAQPRSLRLDGRFFDDAATARLAIENAHADAMVVVAYGLILPQWVLDVPTKGCLNIHASLLPRWRGAAPIHRAIEAGDSQTGVTIIQMDAGLDTGDMLLKEYLPITASDTTADLHDRLAAVGADLIVKALGLAACDGLQPVPQPAEGVSYAHKIDKAEAVLDWTLPATVLNRRIRAFSPFPGASAKFNNEVFKVWSTYVVESDKKVEARSVLPGQVIAVEHDGVHVATGEGVLVLTELQRAGGKRMPAADFLHGFPLLVGQVFDAAANLDFI